MQVMPGVPVMIPTRPGERRRKKSYPIPPRERCAGSIPTRPHLRYVPRSTRKQAMKPNARNHWCWVEPVSRPAGANRACNV